MKTKRIVVTIAVSIPAEWTVGETQNWFEAGIRTLATFKGPGKTWKPKPEVGDQRLVHK